MAPHRAPSPRRASKGPSTNAGAEARLVANEAVGTALSTFSGPSTSELTDTLRAGEPVEPHHKVDTASTVIDSTKSPKRTMQGFGVNTFRLSKDAGHSSFVKFHWEPLAGTHSVVWDEAVKINDADPDLHRSDLWESIEAGNIPEYELGFQTFSEAQAEKFSFDVLDATKIVPEELGPVRKVGRMVLNRNPDNFFAETEQVAFGTMNMIPGIDSNDPLLQGRHHSYLDAQLARLGGPNFREIPINAPVAQVHNNQRDGIHRHGIPRGRVAYEPNSLAGGCPFQAGMRGFVSFPQPVKEDKVRGKPEKFADLFTQAGLFFRSQTPVEQNHIVAAFRFELTKVQTNAIRERVLSMLVNADAGLATRVAAELGKTILVLGEKSALVAACGLSEALPDGGRDPGLLKGRAVSTLAFLAALGRQRHFERETDPPAV